MKGIILAGGTGTRLRPLTGIVNKHLLPVGKYPMIHYGLVQMAEAGIKEVILVTGKQSAGLYAEYIGSGRSWGLQVSFSVQEEAGGIAQALGLAEACVHPGDKLMVLLGDNLFGDSLKEAVRAFEAGSKGAHVFLKEVDDPRRYGVAEIADGRIVRIVEKPEQPPSSYAVTGAYLYDYSVFGIIRTLRPSDRGELEITDVNNAYAAKGLLDYSLLPGWWTDAGTHRSLLEAGMRLMKEET
ncbi:glucose-1-phosphate thymidylyltransferase [Paenibacillus sp. UNCCL117]|uniref:sugar phosphate nucleotidyltransferase n=1 Tax=unclassified Paenibacillus TaxID=185978 RepID=UPI000889AA9A|nr:MULTISPECIES: sugar phosphate nucleotidyltransferase [unclassified Paenibacillus]SDD30595.1 glucose-1-phosphate thymidylyltransferase [Paenibacillus sp. cl123]SFW40316.1 glucose-1-phosphate thymidylyltransferase [Paenibacillus sp. UNCCL117]